MNQALKRRSARTAQQPAGTNLLFLLVVLVLGLGIGYYGLMALTSGDWLWFSSTFEAQPRQLAVIDRGERTEITLADPRFKPVVDALNQTISAGYTNSSVGFSDPTWNLVEQHGILVEASYAEPVRLHGNFLPTTKIRVLLAGERIHTTQVLFRSGDGAWDRRPIRLSTVAPLQTALAQHGLAPLE